MTDGIANEFLLWLLFAVCLVLSFVLSGMEAGVFALSRLRIRQQVRAGKRSARVLQGFMDHPENFLWTILVGNTLANFFILGWLVFVLHDLVGRPRWFALVFSGLVFLLYAFFDLLPKTLFRMYPNRLCIALARPFEFVHKLLRPLVGLVERVSDLLLRWRGGRTFTGHLFGNREELRQLMQDSAQALSSEERVMISRVLDLQTITVRHSMTPLANVIMLNTASPLEEALRVAREHNLTRIPVWETRENQRRIAGLLNVDQLLFTAGLDPQRPVSEHLKPALYLDGELRLEVALRRMQRGGERLAIVLGLDRREIGVISLQDILKNVFGEVTF